MQAVVTAINYTGQYFFSLTKSRRWGQDKISERFTIKLIQKGKLN